MKLPLISILSMLAVATIAAALAAGIIYRLLTRRQLSSSLPGGESPELHSYLAAEGERARVLHAKVDQAAASLQALSGAFNERRRREEEGTLAIERIERVVIGSWSKGKAGENLLAAALGEFPADMLVRDFKIGGRVVEFGLRMPDGKILPIDSKWPAVEDLDVLVQNGDPSAVEAARRRVEKAVCLRLKEVAGYIDPSLTIPLAVVAVPDHVYSCCRKAHASAAEMRLVLVSYSTALPILLSIWNLYRTYARDVDSGQVLDRVHEISLCLTELGDRIEGQLARGLKQATNAAAEMRSLVSSAQLGLAAIAPVRSGSPRDLPEVDFLEQSV